MGRSTRQNPSPNPLRSLPSLRKSSRKAAAATTVAAAPKAKPAPKPKAPKKATASKVADANVAIPSIEPAAPQQERSAASQAPPAPTHGRVTRAATRSQTKSRSPFSPDNILQYGKSFVDKVTGRKSAATKTAPKSRKLTKTRKTPVEDAYVDEPQPSLPQIPETFVKHDKRGLETGQDSDEEEARPSKRPRVESDESDSIPTTEQEAISPSHIPNPRAGEKVAYEQEIHEPQSSESEAEEHQALELEAVEPEIDEQQAHEPQADAPISEPLETITTQEVIADIANNPLPSDKVERAAEMHRRFDHKTLVASFGIHSNPVSLQQSLDSTRRWLHTEGAHPNSIEEFEERAAKQMTAAIAAETRQAEFEHEANRSMTSEELNAVPSINLRERLTHLPEGLSKTESLRRALSMPKTPEKKVRARKLGDRTERRNKREMNKARETAKKQSTISKSMARSPSHSLTPNSRVTSSVLAGLPELLLVSLPQDAEEVTAYNHTEASEVLEATASRLPQAAGEASSHLPELSEVASSHLLEVSDAAISHLSEFISVNLPKVSWRFSPFEIAKLISSFPHTDLTHVNQADTMRLFTAYLCRHDRVPNMSSVTPALQFYLDMTMEQVIENLSYIEDDLPEFIMPDALSHPRDRAQQITDDTGAKSSESESIIIEEEAVDEKMDMDPTFTPQTPSKVWSALPNWGTVSKIKDVLLSPAKYFGLGSQTGGDTVAADSTFTFRQPSGIAASREPQPSPTRTKPRVASQKRTLHPKSTTNATPLKKLPRQSSQSPRKSAQTPKAPVPIHLQGVFLTKEDEMAARQRLKAKQEREAALIAEAELASLETARQETVMEKRNAYAATVEEAENEESENPHNITLAAAGQHVGEKRKRTPASSGCFRVPSPSDDSSDDGNNADDNDNNTFGCAQEVSVEEEKVPEPFEQRMVLDEDKRPYRVDTSTDPYAEYTTITRYTPAVDPYDPATKVNVKSYYRYVNSPPKARALSMEKAAAHFGDYWRQIFEIQYRMSNVERYWDNFFRKSDIYTIWNWLDRHGLAVPDPTGEWTWLLNDYYEMMLLKEKGCWNPGYSAPEDNSDEDEVVEQVEEEVAKEVAVEEGDVVPPPPPTPQHAMLPQQALQLQQTPLSQIAGNASNKYQPAIPSKLRNMTVMSPIHQTGIENAPISMSIYSKYLSASTEPFQGFSREIVDAVMNAPRADLDQFFL